jgi:hypothetical protein
MYIRFLKIFNISTLYLYMISDYMNSKEGKGYIRGSKGLVAPVQKRFKAPRLGLSKSKIYHFSRYSTIYNIFKTQNKSCFKY